MKMNKLTIPTILAATVMIAGIFAFMPIEQASTVHTTIVLAGFEANALGVGDIATGAITADALATDAVLEIQTGVIDAFAGAAGVDFTCISDAPFTVYFNVANLANGETLVITGTAGHALTYTALVAATAANELVSGSLGAGAGETIILTLDAAGTSTLTIVSGIGSSANCA